MAGLLVLLATGACGAGTAAPATSSPSVGPASAPSGAVQGGSDLLLRDVTGLPDPWVRSLGETCWASGDVSDIVGFALVTVRDDAGAVVATSKLAPGVPAGDHACRFGFTIPELPQDGTLSVTIASGRLGAFEVTSEERGATGGALYLHLDR